MNRFSAAAFTASLLFLPLQATSLPVASSKPELNLQHYFEYEFENEIELTCKKKSTYFTCLSKNQTVSEVDDSNVSTVTSFKNAEFRFNQSMNSVLEKKFFTSLLKELKENDLQDDFELPSPLEDIFDRALAESLEYISVDNLDIKVSDPKSHINVKEIVYENRMKKEAKGIKFKERILGEAELKYKDAVFDTDGSDSMYQSVPDILEELLESGDKKRSEYVGKKLEDIYAKYAKEPLNGFVSVYTKYLGDDTVSLDVKMKNIQEKVTSQILNFSSEIRNISAIVESDKNAQLSAMPDLLFKSLFSHTKNSNDSYKNLIKKDKKFAQYISEYNTLLNNYFDKELKKYTQNAVVKRWLNETKTAFSKLITAKADTLEISVKNKNGMTAMQLFGMLMGQLMTVSAQQKGAEDAQTKIILDTAAQNLEVMIKAK